MSTLSEQKASLIADLEIIKKLKSTLAADATGIVETIRLGIKLVGFIYATIKEKSIKEDIEKIEALIYEEEHKTNNEHEANANEGIG